MDRFDTRMFDILSQVKKMGNNMDEEMLMKMKPSSLAPGFLPMEAVNKIFNAVSENDSEITAYDISVAVLSYIFGIVNEEQNLKKAKKLTDELYDRLIKTKKEKLDSNEDEKYFWIQEYAIANILYGLIYSYEKEYIKAVYHFMIGLKTNMVSLRMPICDFIKYIANKLPTIKCKEYKGSGIGFSMEQPAGNIDGKIMDSNYAGSLLSKIEGDNGEVVAAKVGRTGLYGYLQRTGSLYPIDIYETYIIDKKYKLYKAKLFINNYINFTHSSKELLPNNFHIIENLPN